MAAAQPQEPKSLQNVKDGLLVKESREFLIAVHEISKGRGAYYPRVYEALEGDAGAINKWLSDIQKEYAELTKFVIRGDGVELADSGASAVSSASVFSEHQNRGEVIDAGPFSSSGLHRLQGAAASPEDGSHAPQG